MDWTFNVALVGVTATVLVLVFLYGPVVTAFVVAGAAFALMVAMIALSGVQAFESWWAGHHWSMRRTKTH